MSKPLTLRHEPAANRFVAELDGGLAVLDYTQIAAGTWEYRHTYVPARFRHRGIASTLVKYALDEAEARGMKIVPTCPFVDRVIRDNPQYEKLVPDR